MRAPSGRSCLGVSPVLRRLHHAGGGECQVSPSSLTFPRFQVLTAGIHTKDAISMEAKWYLSKECRASFLSRKLKPQWTRRESLLSSHLRAPDDVAGAESTCGHHSKLQSLIVQQIIKSMREKVSRWASFSVFSKKKNVYLGKYKYPGNHCPNYYKN